MVYTAKKFFRWHFLAIFFGISLFFGGTAHANHLTVDLGGFKCPLAPRPDQKLAIFKIITPPGENFPEQGDENGHFDDTTGQPKTTEGKFFCVLVGKDATQATWPEMVSGQDQDGKRVLEPGLGDEDLRGQQRDHCANVGNNWTSFQSDHPVANGPYVLNDSKEVDCPGGGGYIARVRYYLNDLDEVKDELFLYYMKIAEPADYGGGESGVCAAFHGNKSQCDTKNECFYWQEKGSCVAKSDINTKCVELSVDMCVSALHCQIDPKDATKCQVKASLVDTQAAVTNYIQERYGVPTGYDGPLPDCAFSGTCRKFEDLLDLAITSVEWMFGIIAGLAFAFFVYGGITMIMSFGNSEKVSKGKEIMVAAAVGLVIVFSAYIVIGFVVDAIGIKPELNQIN